MSDPTSPRTCSLPPLEPEVFDGNPRQYIQWISEFNTIIESQVTDPHMRLCYLKKYTEGRARKAIEGFLYVSTPISYNKAQELLKKRFGDPKLIHHEIRMRVESWEPMNGESASAERLREFSDLLDTVLMLKNEVLSLSEETQAWDIPLLLHNTIITKLPRDIVKKWREKVQKKKPEEYFPTLCDCVREEADGRFDFAYIYPSSPLYKEHCKNGGNS